MIFTALFAMSFLSFTTRAQIPNTATSFYSVKYSGAKGNGTDLDIK